MSEDANEGPRAHQLLLKDTRGWVLHLASYAAILDDDGKRKVRESVPEEYRGGFDQAIASQEIWDELADAPAVRAAARKREVEDKADRLYQKRKAEREGRTNTWARIDPAQALRAADTPVLPDVGFFRETKDDPPHGVFYSGKINEVHGESESGKSMLVLHGVAQELMAGHGVVYVDYEDDEGAVYGRLMNIMGVPRDVLDGDLFRYHRPNGPMGDAEKEQLYASLALGGSLVVFDGVTEGMALEGLNGREESEVAAWHAKITKDIAQAGWCVVLIDHTPHDQKRTLGSQHKKAAISGVSYLVEAAVPLVAGQRGVLRLKVEKDRPGTIRREAAPGPRPQWRGDLVLDSSTQPAEVNLWPASPSDEGQGFDAAPPAKLCQAVVGFVGANPDCGSREIRAGVKGSTDLKEWALRWLIAQGYIAAERKGPKILHRALREWEESS